jgi:hypothetical protein
MFFKIKKKKKKKRDSLTNLETEVLEAVLASNPSELYNVRKEQDTI